MWDRTWCCEAFGVSGCMSSGLKVWGDVDFGAVGFWHGVWVEKALMQDITETPIESHLSPLAGGHAEPRRPQGG